MERAKRWVKVVDDAAARPENAQVVAQVRKESKNDDIFRRSWAKIQGATAPEAAGVIHTDFQKGFIKAEVVSFDDLVDAGNMAEAKSHGKVRMEGKDYVMRDGDVVEFRFNV